MHKNEAVPSLVVSFYSQDNNNIFIFSLRCVIFSRLVSSYSRWQFRTGKIHTLNLKINPRLSGTCCNYTIYFFKFLVLMPLFIKCDIFSHFFYLLYIHYLQFFVHSRVLRDGAISSPTNTRQ